MKGYYILYMPQYQMHFVVVHIFKTFLKNQKIFKKIL